MLDTTCGDSIRTVVNASVSVVEYPGRACSQRVAVLDFGYVMPSTETRLPSRSRPKRSHTVRPSDSWIKVLSLHSVATGESF